MAPAGPGKALDGVDVQLLEPLERAVGAGDADVTAMLLASGTQVLLGIGAAHGRPLRRTVLHWAAFGGNPDVVEAVLEAVASRGVAAADGANVDAADAAKSDALEARCLSGTGGLRGTTPLHLAAKHGHVAAAIVLLEAGAPDTYVDELDQPPLALAVTAGHDDMVAELLKRGSLHVDDTLHLYRSTAVHLAAKRGHLGMVEMFLREGADVNVREGLDETPLHYAVRRGPNAEAITVALLAAGAEVNWTDDIGDSAIWMTSDVAVRRALFVGGADLHEDRGNGRPSAVEEAMQANNVEELSLFLELGLDPNHRGPFNKPFKAPPRFDTPEYWDDDRVIRHYRRPYGGASLLHRAARCLSAVAVELLLAAGAREDIPALRDVRQENAPEISTLPMDVIGVVKEMTPELQRRADAIRSMLAGAHLYRKGWLSVLRARFDAGESLTGSDGTGEAVRGGAGSDGVEGPLPQRQKKAGGGSSSTIGGVEIAVEDEAWYGAALWIARVPGPEVFRIITEYL